MHLVGVDERVDNVFVKVERVICGLELGAILGGLNEVVLMWVMRCVASLELVIGVNDGFVVFLLGAAVLDIAGLDAKHEGNADHHNKHERVH